MNANTQQQLKKNYQAIRVMGQGSFGKVFLVRNIQTRSQYAMKKYSYNQLVKCGKQLSLQRSVKILQSLNHKGILKIVKYIITKEDSIYLFFEACKKGSLDKITKLLRKANERDLIDFVIFQLVEALRYLKSVSVAHRDLKPSNIAVTNQGILKIIDFDQAICFNPAYLKGQSLKMSQFPQINQNPIYVSRRSRAMSYVGTDLYMSPQMKSKTQSDQRGDIWAFGCIVYQIFMDVTMCSDFQDQKDLADDIRNRLNLFAKEKLTGGYVDLLQKILTINPNDRISIQEIYEHQVFQKFRTNTSHYDCCQYRLKKLLRGNYNLPDPKTLIQSLSVDLIGMKAGKQTFQQLKTVVLFSKQHEYQILHLIGGCQYFKLRSISDQNQKRYIFYDQIQSIKIVNEFIVIKIISQQWSHSNQKQNKEIYLKHIYQDQLMLGNLYTLMMQILND